MNRIAVVAIAVVTAAVGLFVLSRWSSDRDSEAVVVHRGSGSEIAVGSRAGDAGRESTAGGRRAGRAAPGSAESRAGEHVGEDGDADQRHGSTVVSSARARRAAKSKAEGGRSTIGERGMGRASDEASTDSSRGELVDFLATQEPSRQHVSESDDIGGADVEDSVDLAEEEADGHDDDLLLSVPLDGSTEAEDLTQPIIEENLPLDGEEEGIEFPEDSILAFADAASFIGDAGTISIDIEPNWNGSDGGDNSFVQVRTPDMWHGPFFLWRNGQFLRFNLIDNNGWEYNVGADVKSWTAGDRHTVTVTWGEALMSLYIDGQLIGQTTYVGYLSIPPDTPLYLGSNPPGRGPGAGATLQNFKVYGRALGPEEIADR